MVSVSVRRPTLNEIVAWLTETIGPRGDAWEIFMPDKQGHFSLIFEKSSDETLFRLRWADQL